MNGMKRTAQTLVGLMTIGGLLSACASFEGSKQGDSSSANTAEASSTAASISPTPTPTPTQPSPTMTPTPSPTESIDPDRPADALSIGESTRTDDILVTLEKFQKVKPKEPLDGFRYYGAKMSFTNMTDGPKEILAEAQVRLENVYVATVKPVSVDIKEGESVPFGAFRPGATVTGWVVWAVPDFSEILKSFGIYYTDLAGNEVVWWNNIP